MKIKGFADDLVARALKYIITYQNESENKIPLYCPHGRLLLKKVEEQGVNSTKMDENNYINDIFRSIPSIPNNIPNDDTR